MYNRYIPQPDGSYRRNRMEDACSQAKPPRKETCEKSAPPAPPCQEVAPCPPPPREPSCVRQDATPGFLRQLLPRDLDTGDLIVILLLLLMAGDCEEDKSTALLTLALYLIM